MKSRSRALQAAGDFVRAYAMTAGFAPLVIALLLASPINAGADEDQRARAKVLAEEGLRAYRSGDYPSALRDFQQANAIEPNPRLFFNIGLAQVRGNNPQAAARSFDLFLSEATSYPHVPSKNVEVARSELARLEPDWAKLILRIQPESSEVVLDGTLVDRGPNYVDRAHPHTLQVRAPGHLAAQRDLSPPALGPITIELQLELAPPVIEPSPIVGGTAPAGLAVVRAPEAVATVAQPIRRPEPSVALPVTLLAAGGALVAGGAIGLGWSATVNQAEAAQQPAGARLTVSRAQFDLAHGVYDVAWVGAGVGLGLAAYGLWDLLHVNAPPVVLAPVGGGAVVAWSGAL